MKKIPSLDSFGARSKLIAAGGDVSYFDLGRLAAAVGHDISQWPFSMKIVLESLLRNEDGHQVGKRDIADLAAYDPKSPRNIEVPYKPARVLLQDFTGVPALVDLAALRSAMARFGKDPKRINPLIPVDLVVDHSIQVDAFATPSALRLNSDLEFERNRERYEFLHWGQKTFEGLRVIPPESGICHQVNLEYLAQVVQQEDTAGGALLFPDTLVGTDSHTPMIGGLGVLGWGVGGIEAEAVILGQPLYMLAPSVVGVRLVGALPSGATATDLVLRVTELLREKGVVGKFVEFFGQGLSSLTVQDRATIANMAPEYGATISYFPVDDRTLDYLSGTGRNPSLIQRVWAYCQAQGLYRTDETPDPIFEDVVEVDLGRIETSLAGPKRPQDRISLTNMKANWQRDLSAPPEERGYGLTQGETSQTAPAVLEDGTTIELGHGAVAIAAITSCTNTSNPSVVLAAGLLAKKAVERGLAVKPWVKTSLAPGSIVVTDYLKSTGLMPHLEALGFHVVGYGCTTCIGNSGPLPPPIARAVESGDLVVASVLSGNRNFEGRINPHVKANYLASPPLVVAYALAGTVDIDLDTEPIGQDNQGNPVPLKDIWPSADEIAALWRQAMQPAVFSERYEGIEASNDRWNQIGSGDSPLYAWHAASTYLQEPPFFEDLEETPAAISPIRDARVLVYVRDSVTTDHISPAGAIGSNTPAGQYLIENGVAPADFNSYGSRRGNDKVMTRGTFANIRLRNEMAPGTEGGFTTHVPSGEVMAIFQAANRYKSESTPTIVLAGKDYGMGSSRDWAAKGSRLLGIRAVIAVSFERIHRSNLVGMGVLPLQLPEGTTPQTLGLTGKETYTIDIDDDLKPGAEVVVTIQSEGDQLREMKTRCRLDTPIEVAYFKNGGILHTVLRQFLTATEPPHEFGKRPGSVYE
ncbi:MAG: aconitate hydratase AcnA [Myxococcota bacterium]|nr:aconitate hydratase AcnA [Myxococcota bacterium]